MTYSATIKIAGLPKTPNARMHWALKMAEVKTWRRRVALAFRAHSPDVPLHRANLVFTRLSASRPDFDNLVASFKAAQDGLIDARIIANDTFDVVGTPTYLWEKVSPKNGAIKIQVTEAL
jgi:Holliday junction resolvase RusA-like endonuclease